MNVNKVAIIPARGGSKRIPRKNIREFAGLPMIAHSIRVALESKIFSRVIVSTDDLEIAEIAKIYGAEVPFQRPKEISDDHATTISVISHAIEWLKKNDSVEPEIVACIYATAPFIQLGDLIQGSNEIETGKWDYVFSGTTFGFPIFRSFEKAQDGSLKMFYPEHFNTRSQDLPEAYHDAGQFYFGRAKAWIEGKRIFDIHSTIVEIPRWRVQDIDTMEDWKRAEILHKLLQVD